MGAVFLCEDLRLAGKRWALKEMLANDAEVLELVQESFRREAAILSRLRHRNLPMIVDYFVEDTRQYLVMEYLEGETLAKVIQRDGPASELQCLKWGLELAQVLDYLHRQEKPIIFRDLKPDNIIVTDDKHIKLIDFGLARQFDPVKRHDTQASGSVGYAPPEQWEDTNQTDERSDIYSLGAVLFYVLTGRPPSPVYGSQRLRPYRPTIEQGAEAIVLRCLQPNPNDRHRSSAELIRELLLWLSKQKGQEPKEQSSNPGNKHSVASVPPSSTRKVRGSGEPIQQVTRIVSDFVPKGMVLALRSVTLAFLVSASVSAFYLSSPKIQSQMADPVAVMLTENSQEKSVAKAAISRAEYPTAVTILDKVILRSPRDAEAAIMRNNAYAMMQNRPTYRIPVITSYSGTEREGFQMLYGLALAQQEINQKGIREHSVVLDLFDCESMQDKTLTIAAQLGKNHDYCIAVGPVSSQQTVAVAPIVEGAGLPLLAPYASDPRVWTMGQNIFTINDSDTRRVTLIAEHFSKLGLRQGVVIHNEESLVSRSMANEFIDSFSKGGGQVLQSLTYSEAGQQVGETRQFVRSDELQRVLAKVRELPVEFVFVAEYRADILTTIVQAFHQMGSKYSIASQAVVSPESPLLKASPPIDGLISSTYFDPDSAQPDVKDFSAKIGAQFDKLKPSHREALAYDALMMASRAIEEAGFERRAVRDYLRSLGTERPKVHGVTGDYAPGIRLDLRTPYLAEIRSGHFFVTKELQPNGKSANR